MKTTGREMHGDLYINGVRARENELHEPILEEVKEERVVVEHYWRIKCPNCSETLCGSSWRDGLEEEIPNYCPTCGARLKEVE